MVCSTIPHFSSHRSAEVERPAGPSKEKVGERSIAWVATIGATADPRWATQNNDPRIQHMVADGAVMSGNPEGSCYITE